jgi:hypothetical protein
MDMPDHTPDRESVIAQLERLLSSPYFSGSKRCPAMLRHVVLRTLDGQAHELKERTLGVEVFHRPPDYDTNIDPVVRLAAGDIRKRLAQYYCEPEHEHALRIALPPGSYVPEFHLFEPSSAVDPEAHVLAPQNPSREAVRWRRRAAIMALVAAACVLLATLGFAAHHYVWRSAYERFWGPVRNGGTPLLICVGQPDHAMGEEAYKQLLAQSSLAYHTLRVDQVTTADAMAAARISGVLGKEGISYTLQGADSTTFSDIRKGPSVLVSGADNQWTLHALKDLRFYLWGEASGPFAKLWITDRKNPSRKDWAVDFNTPYTALSQDYAIIGRFYDPATGQIAVVAAGVGANGTLSAAECLADNECLRKVLEQDPNKGRKSNIEAVLGTQVIGGRSGPPSVLAVTSW